MSPTLWFHHSGEGSVDSLSSEPREGVFFGGDLGGLFYVVAHCAHHVLGRLSGLPHSVIDEPTWVFVGDLLFSDVGDGRHSPDGRALFYDFERWEAPASLVCWGHHETRLGFR